MQIFHSCYWHFRALIRYWASERARYLVQRLSQRRYATLRCRLMSNPRAAVETVCSATASEGVKCRGLWVLNRKSSFCQQFLSTVRTTATPAYLSCHLQTRHSARHLRSSGTPLLSRSSSRTDFVARGFRHSAPAVWNSLSRTVLYSPPITVFKSRLKTHCFTWRTLTNITWPALPPPLKLRPYGSIEICVLLLHWSYATEVLKILHFTKSETKDCFWLLGEDCLYL